MVVAVVVGGGEGVLGVVLIHVHVCSPSAVPSMVIRVTVRVLLAGLLLTFTSAIAISPSATVSGPPSLTSTAERDERTMLILTDTS